MDLEKNERFKSKVLEGIVFPPVPFHAIITNKKFARKHELAAKKILVITHVYFDKEESRIKFAILKEFFYFPWDCKSLEIYTLFKPN